MTDFEMSLIETDLIVESLSFHIPHSKNLDPEHPYFRKQLLWTLTAWNETEINQKKEVEEAIEEDEKNGIRYAEIYIKIVESINGIDAYSIQHKLNTSNCFTFDYNPIELDNLTFQGTYLYKEIKAVRRPQTGSPEFISFTFQKGGWNIDKNYEMRNFNNIKKGIVQIKSKVA